MKRILCLVVIAGAGGLTLLGTALASPASAGNALCGSTVSANLTLTGNVNCSGLNSGIRVANGITLDCNKFSILGNAAAKGEGPGITVTQNSTVRNCTVKYFDAGIYIQPGAGNNLITINTLQDNVGTGNYGDGIATDTSSNNRITANTVSSNGPYDGIGLVGKSNNNLIQFNTVSNNNVPSGGGQNDGIRIEGPGAQNNRVQYNTVSGNGLDGIAVFGNQGTPFNNTGTIINGNSVTGNGYNGVTRLGHGIVLFLSGNQTTVTNNTSTGNAADGIRVGSLSNTITGNVATGNMVIDLHDLNAGCNTNAWHNNKFGTAQPACAGAA